MQCIELCMHELHACCNTCVCLSTCARMTMRLSVPAFASICMHACACVCRAAGFFVWMYGPNVCMYACMLARTVFCPAHPCGTTCTELNANFEFTCAVNGICRLRKRWLLTLWRMIPYVCFLDCPSAFFYKQSWAIICLPRSRCTGV